MSPYKDYQKQIEANRRSCRKHREEISRRRKQWRVEHKDEIRIRTLGVKLPDGRNRTIYNLNKRLRPERCELCQKKTDALVYHHWDDLDYNKGMWICRGACHTFAERIEKGWIERYVALKNRIEMVMVKIVSA